MSKSTSLYHYSGVTVNSATITSSTGTGAVAVITAGTDDSTLRTLILVSTSASAHDVQLLLNDGTTDHLIGTVAVPANAGNLSSVQPVDGLSFSFLPLDAGGKKVLPIEGTANANGYACTLRAKVSSALASGETITITAQTQDY